jgi:serpin B
MMHQHSPLLYAEDENLQLLEIPYIDHTYSMFVILPKKVLSVKKMIPLVTNDRIEKLMLGALPREVDVLFPKFEMRSHLGVKKALSDLGVHAAFNKQTANFDKMIVKKNEAFRVYISEIYHDAWISVHEEGTEAAAATTTTHFSLGCSASPRPARAQFHADHPFLFLVVHTQSRSILFTGWVSDPGKLAQ